MRTMQWMATGAILITTLFGASCTPKKDLFKQTDASTSKMQPTTYARSVVSATEKKAMKGDRKSQYALGYMYYHGIGATQNKELGLKWMNQAAANGEPAAIAALKMINASHPKETVAQTTPSSVMTAQSTTETQTQTTLTSNETTSPTTQEKTTTISKTTNEPKWAIRLGVFKNERNTRLLLEELKTAGYSTFTKEINRDGQVLTSVFVGPHDTKTQAKELETKLEAKFKLKGTVVKNDAV